MSARAVALLLLELLQLQLRVVLVLVRQRRHPKRKRRRKKRRNPMTIWYVFLLLQVMDMLTLIRNNRASVYSTRFICFPFCHYTSSVFSPYFYTSHDALCMSITQPKKKTNETLISLPTSNPGLHKP